MSEEHKVEQERIRSRLANGCSNEEFDAMRCPVCGSSLGVIIKARFTAFFVHCSKVESHFGVHGDGVPELWQVGSWPTTELVCRKDAR
jgi:hypothetical protein